MSWLDRIEANLVIKTGDGKQFTPLYVNANKTREYNISEYDFIKLPGTYIKRKLYRGAKYTAEIIFQGLSHLDDANALEQSTNASSEPWEIEHPIYGSLLVQPSSLVFSNGELNVTRISCTLLETIRIDVVNELKVSPKTQIEMSAKEIFDISVEEFVVNNPTVPVQVKRNLVNQLINQYQVVSKKIVGSIDANSFLNDFNKSLNVLNSVGSLSLSIAQAVQRFSTLPYIFEDSIQNRISIFKLQYEQVKLSANNLFKRNSKKVVEFQFSNTITAMLLSTVINANYENADEVLKILDGIWDIYDDYILELDNNSDSYMVDENSYIPDYESVTKISLLLSFVSDALLKISQNTKTKFVYRVVNDLTLFELTSILYGLDAEDKNINKVINDNNLCINNLFVINKGTDIIYYK